MGSKLVYGIVADVLHFSDQARRSSKDGHDQSIHAQESRSGRGKLCGTTAAGYAPWARLAFGVW